jgi:hypothetical protein
VFTFIGNFYYCIPQSLSSVLSLQFEELSFSISCRADLVVMKFLHFSLLRNVLISPSFLKDSFARYRTLGWHSPPFLVEIHHLIAIWPVRFLLCLLKKNTIL